jgi:hypothetical protein
VSTKKTGGLGAFAAFSRRSVLAAASPAVWVTASWLRLVPVYRGQREQMAGLLTVIGAFGIAYLYLISPWFQRRALRRCATRSRVDWLICGPPVAFLFLSLCSFWMYSRCIDQSAAVTEADLVAGQQQEVSALARDYCASAAEELAPADRYEKAARFLESQGAHVPLRSAVLEIAKVPPAFGGRLLIFSAGAVLFAMLTFLWMSMFEYLRKRGGEPPPRSRQAVRTVLTHNRTVAQESASHGLDREGSVVP